MSLTRAVRRQLRSPGIGKILECQGALSDQSDLGLHYLLKPVCPNTRVKRKCYGILALDRISCVMVWPFVVMTLSGINYKNF